MSELWETIVVMLVVFVLILFVMFGLPFVVAYLGRMIQYWYEWLGPVS